MNRKTNIRTDSRKHSLSHSLIPSVLQLSICQNMVLGFVHLSFYIYICFVLTFIHLPIYRLDLVRSGSVHYYNQTSDLRSFIFLSWFRISNRCDWDRAYDRVDDCFYVYITFCRMYVNIRLLSAQQPICVYESVNKREILSNVIVFLLEPTLFLNERRKNVGKKKTFKTKVN